MSATANAKVFPFPPTSPIPHEAVASASAGSAAHVGVCFSGGGSRALSATMGQLRGLKYLGVLDDVLFISSVSGGTWASSAFTYLPATYDEDDFLGRIVADPGALTFFNDNPACPECALDFLPPDNLGHVPPGLGILSDLIALRELQDTFGYPDNELWQVLVGTHVLGLWTLWSTGDNGYPDRSYSLGKRYLGGTNGILARNPGLAADAFYLVERQRPFLIMNGTLLSQTPGGQWLPFESTGVGAGVRHAFAGWGTGGSDIGGGAVEPFAFDSVYCKDLSAATVEVDLPPHRFSLNDMAGISSAAFAGVVEKTFPGAFGSLVPEYSYWPVAGRAEAKNAATAYRFGDGGLLDDTGITALLARNVPNIIAFVNGEAPLARDWSGTVTLTTQIPLLFGVASDDGTEETLVKKQLGATLDPAFSQVFATADYAELTAGLAAANLDAGGTAMYTQHLDVLPNANYGIAGGYTARILWIVNTPVQNWTDRLAGDIRLYIDAHPDFPNYKTVTQLDLSAREVNALAHLSAWNVMSDSEAGHPGTTNAQMVLDMFKS